MTTPPDNPRGPWARLAEWEEEQHLLYDDDEADPIDEYSLVPEQEALDEG